MAYLGSFILYGYRVLHHSDSIREFSFLFVDKKCTVDLGALGGGSNVWSNRVSRGNFGYAGKVLAGCSR